MLNKKKSNDSGLPNVEFSSDVLDPEVAIISDQDLHMDNSNHEPSDVGGLSVESSETGIPDLLNEGIRTFQNVGSNNDKKGLSSTDSNDSANDL